jgi:hypothetical protein
MLTYAAAAEIAMCDLALYPLLLRRMLAYAGVC